jgi:hypothetical protein
MFLLGPLTLKHFYKYSSIEVFKALRQKVTTLHKLFLVPINRKKNLFFVSLLPSFSKFAKIEEDSKKRTQSTDIPFGPHYLLLADPAVDAVTNIEDSALISYIDSYVTNPDWDLSTSLFLSNLVRKYTTGQSLYSNNNNSPLTLFYRQNFDFKFLNQPSILIDSVDSYSKEVLKLKPNNSIEDIPFPFSLGTSHSPSDVLVSIVTQYVETNQEKNSSETCLTYYDQLAVITSILGTLYILLDYLDSTDYEDLTPIPSHLSSKLQTFASNKKLVEQLNLSIESIASNSFISRSSNYLLAINAVKKKKYQSFKSIVNYFFSVDLDEILFSEVEDSDTNSTNYFSIKALYFSGLIDFFTLLGEHNFLFKIITFDIRSPEDLILLANDCRDNRVSITELLNKNFLFSQLKNHMNYIFYNMETIEALAFSAQLANESPYQFSCSNFSKNDLITKQAFNSYTLTVEYKDIFYLIDLYNLLQTKYLEKDFISSEWFPDRAILKIYLDKMLATIASYSTCRQHLYGYFELNKYIRTLFQNKNLLDTNARTIEVNGIKVVNRLNIPYSWTLYYLFESKGNLNTNLNINFKADKTTLELFSDFSKTYLREKYNVKFTTYRNLFRIAKNLDFKSFMFTEIRTSVSLDLQEDIVSIRTLPIMSLLLCLSNLDSYETCSYLNSLKLAICSRSLCVLLDTETANKIDSKLSDPKFLSTTGEKVLVLKNLLNLLVNFVVTLKTKVIYTFLSSIFTPGTLVTAGNFYKDLEEYTDDNICSFLNGLFLNSLFTSTNTLQLGLLPLESANNASIINVLNPDVVDLPLGKVYKLAYGDKDIVLGDLFRPNKCLQNHLDMRTNFLLKPWRRTTSSLEHLLFKTINMLAIHPSLELLKQPNSSLLSAKSINYTFEYQSCNKVTDPLHSLYFSRVVKTKEYSSMDLLIFYQDLLDFGRNPSRVNGYLQSTSASRDSNDLSSLLDITIDFENPSSFSIDQSILRETIFRDLSLGTFRWNAKENSNKTFMKKVSINPFTLLDDSTLTVSEGDLIKLKDGSIQALERLYRSNNFDFHLINFCESLYLSNEIDCEQNTYSECYSTYNTYTMFFLHILSLFQPHNNLETGQENNSDVKPFCNTPAASYVAYLSLTCAPLPIEKRIFSVKNRDEIVKAVIEIVYYFKFAYLALEMMENDKIAFLYLHYYLKNTSQFYETRNLVTQFRNYMSSKTAYWFNGTSSSISFYNEETDRLVYFPAKQLFPAGTFTTSINSITYEDISSLIP